MQFLVEVPLPDCDTRFPRHFILSMTTLVASNYFYEHNQLPETRAFETFTDEAAAFVGEKSEKMAAHVKNARQLLQLKGLRLTLLII